MLPTAAVDLLQFDIADAEALANKGDLLAGRDVLRAGLARAAAKAQDEHSWAPELIRYYQEALADYARRHGLPAEEQGEEAGNDSAVS
jgi:hypothetical protein